LEAAMMGRQSDDQGHLFYDFCLAEAVPDDHPVRKIAAVLDLSWVCGELAPYYSTLGRPSIDPVLMMRMLIIGYVFGASFASTRKSAFNGPTRPKRMTSDSLSSTWRAIGPWPPCGLKV
jgi:hypothetical protein